MILFYTFLFIAQSFAKPVGGNSIPEQSILADGGKKGNGNSGNQGGGSKPPKTTPKNANPNTLNQNATTNATNAPPKQEPPKIKKLFKRISQIFLAGRIHSHQLIDCLHLQPRAQQLQRPDDAQGEPCCFAYERSTFCLCVGFYCGVTPCAVWRALKITRNTQKDEVRQELIERL